jgi:hypothetical protein
MEPTETKMDRFKQYVDDDDPAGPPPRPAQWKARSSMERRVAVTTMGENGTREATLLRVTKIEKGVMVGVIMFADGTTKYAAASEGGNDWVSGISDDWMATESEDQ